VAILNGTTWLAELTEPTARHGCANYLEVMVPETAGAIVGRRVFLHALEAENEVEDVEVGEGCGASISDR
jgi:hypothetical protein